MDQSDKEKTINDIWDSIPSSFYKDIYGYIGDSVHAGKTDSPPPITPAFFVYLTDEQLHLVNFIKECAYLERVYGVNVHIR